MKPIGEVEKESQHDDQQHDEGEFHQRLPFEVCVRARSPRKIPVVTGNLICVCVRFIFARDLGSVKSKPGSRNVRPVRLLPRCDDKIQVNS